jgi:membrane protein DedA with SNARE-associated domain
MRRLWLNTAELRLIQFGFVPGASITDILYSRSNTKQMFEFIDQLISSAMTAITSGSPLAIITLFLVVALTECGIPFPFILDSVLFFTSYDTGASIWHILFVICIVFLGREFGSSVIYWLTRLLGNAAIYWFGKRYKQLRYNWASLTSKLSTQAPMPIAVFRISGLMTLASVMAGAMRIRYTAFVAGVALSSLIFDGALIILGLITKYGFSYIGFKPSVWHVAAGLIVVMSVVMIVISIRSRKKAKTTGNGIPGNPSPDKTDSGEQQ